MSESQEILADIQSAAEANGLVLFLGAGVNGRRFPQWRDLVNKLLVEALSPHPEGGDYPAWLDQRNVAFDLYARATLAKTLLGKKYIEVLRQQLYSGNEAEESHVLRIARLCRWPAVKAIVTYNYDTHLEDAYEEIREAGDRPIVSVGLSRQGQATSHSSDRLCVYHVHGLLASPAHLHYAKDDPVVLAYDEYTDVMRDVCNWASATQVHFLRTHTCLFLGLSLSDWNVLRLLQAAHLPGDPLRHWLLTSGQERGDEKLAEFHLKAKATLLESVGIQFALVGGTYKALYEQLVGQLLTTGGSGDKKQDPLRRTERTGHRRGTRRPGQLASQDGHQAAGSTAPGRVPDPSGRKVRRRPAAPRGL
jgi:hypothetical protein